MTCGRRWRSSSQQKFSDPTLQQQLAQLAQQWERFSELAQHGFRGTDPLSIEAGLAHGGPL